MSVFGVCGGEDRELGFGRDVVAAFEEVFGVPDLFGLRVGLGGGCLARVGCGLLGGESEDGDEKKVSGHVCLVLGRRREGFWGSCGEVTAGRAGRSLLTGADKGNRVEKLSLW